MIATPVRRFAVHICSDVALGDLRLWVDPVETKLPKLESEAEVLLEPEGEFGWRGAFSVELDDCRVGFVRLGLVSQREGSTTPSVLQK